LYRSEYLDAPPEKLIGVVLEGLDGPVPIQGRRYQFPTPMPPLRESLDDEEIALILEFVTNAFGNTPRRFSPQLVAECRKLSGN
ncbi:MAG: dehydrogenase, partial [Bacteroidetes bacterium]